ncbi:hypothetical protein V1523DRAFT_443097 [Lipomyces doorenjongii]
MSTEALAFSCGSCDHAPFDSPDKLNKHTSSKHRQSSTFNYNGASYPLISAEGKYLCPKCSSSMASISGLRRHLARVCRRRSGHTSAALTIIEPRTLDDFEFTYENTWQIAICNRCHFVVDMAMVIEHLTTVHGLGVQSHDSVLRVLRTHRLRPHLAIIWDNIIEDQLDESDDEDQGPQLFNPPVFRPGSVSLRGIPVQDGFKCRVCAQNLRHVCVTTKEGMRTHYKRNHKGQVVEYQDVKVQAFYGRSRSVAQLRYVQVREREDQAIISALTDKRDLNLFGSKFQVYPLLETLDLSDLGPLLYSPQDTSFELLKHLCLKMFRVTREDTRAGFQPMLGKVMVGERDKYVATNSHLYILRHI